ncbi:MAG: glycosyltransferase family 1 protein [Candidatus Omnitrophota bacterium]
MKIVKKKDRTRLGIDARILSQPMNGVARHLILLLKSLAKKKEFEVFLFSDTPLMEEYSPYFSGYRLILFDRPGLKKYWKNWVLPFQLSKHRIDLYHSVWDKGVPLISPCPVVMSIHDLYSISGENKTAKKSKKARRRIGLLLETLKAKKIMTISESTRIEIIEKLRVPPEKVVAAYLDCDRQYIKDAASREDGRDLPYGLAAGGYFISVAGRLDDVRKNTPFLIRSFSKFLGRHPGPGIKLVVVGSYDASSGPFIALKKLAAEYNIEKDVVFTGYVPDGVLYNLIRRSIAVIFTSTFEGFGIPILEAFALGAPVITSDRSSMREIASGGSALLVDPASEENLVSAMSSLVSDTSLRKRLSENGRKRLGDFDWNIAMEKITDVYYDILR